MRPDWHARACTDAGLLRSQSVVTMVMQNFAAMGVITILWFAFVFSLCFGHTYYFIGSPSTFAFFRDVEGTSENYLGFVSTIMVVATLSLSISVPLFIVERPAAFAIVQS